MLLQSHKTLLRVYLSFLLNTIREMHHGILLFFHLSVQCLSMSHNNSSIYERTLTKFVYSFMFYEDLLPFNFDDLRLVVTSISNNFRMSSDNSIMPLQMKCLHNVRFYRDYLSILMTFRLISLILSYGTLIIKILGIEMSIDNSCVLSQNYMEFVNSVTTNDC